MSGEDNDSEGEESESPDKPSKSLFCCFSNCLIYSVIAVILCIPSYISKLALFESVWFESEYIK